MSEKNPLASIIVLTYNQEELIGKTLQSLVSQKTTFPYEIIVCDDCSQDGTRNVIREYASKYPQIVAVFNEYNLGIVKNYAKASSLCHGKYRAGCAGDDYWIDEKKLQKQVEVMEANPNIAMVYTDAMIDSVNTGHRYVRRSPEPDVDLFNQLLKGNFITAATVCYRKEALHTIDYGEYVHQKFIMEDYPTYLDLASQYSFFHIPEVTVNYRVDRISNDNVEKALVDSCAFAAETLRLQKYFIRKYPQLAKITEYDVEDACHKICYKDMLCLHRKNEAIQYMKMIHKKSIYVKAMIVLLTLPLGDRLYYWYYQKKHPEAAPLSFYFGGEKCE